jgi:hypothetical protein
MKAWCQGKHAGLYRFLIEECRSVPGQEVFHLKCLEDDEGDQRMLSTLLRLHDDVVVSRIDGTLGAGSTSMRRILPLVYISMLYW